MAELGPTFDVGVTDLGGLADLAVAQKVDLTVVGPEIPLVAGIVDLFAERRLRVFGPTQAAAEIEGSKVFCNALAKRHGVPVAAGESFDDADAAIDFARTIAPPIVVKADGLAAGKGVLICRELRRSARRDRADDARRHVRRVREPGDRRGVPRGTRDLDVLSHGRHHATSSSISRRTTSARATATKA